MNYWQERALAIQAEARDLALTTELRLQRVYEKNLRESLKSYNKLVKDVSDIKAQYRTDRRFRVAYDRLAANIVQSLEHCSSIVDKDTLALLVNVYKTTAIEYGYQSFSLLNTKAIEQIVKKPWCSDGLIFSDRIWKNTDKLKAKLSDTMLSSVVKGESIQKTAKEVQKTFGVSLGQAKRLVRTETAAIYTEAALDSYSNTDIEYYEIIGDADCGNTGVCPIGEIFRVDEAGSHDTPPFHPNCKCCIAPVPNYVAQGY